MKISVDRKDPSFVDRTYLASVTYNGKNLDYCISADEERGEVEVYELGSSGLPLADTEGNVIFNVLKGDVKLNYKYKVFDCFMFFNEFDIALLRFEELYDFVDKFIVVETDITHSGKQKPFYFKENQQLFEKFADKIVLHTVKLQKQDIWERENEHRQKLCDSLEEHHPESNDIILISDCDEIPNVETLKRTIFSQDFDCLNFSQMYFTYFADFFSGKSVTGTSIVKYGYVNKLKEITFQPFQYIRNKKDFGEIISNGGWHYSYFGGAQQMKKKSESFCHAEDFIQDTQCKSKDSPLSYFEQQVEDAIKHNKTPYSHRPIQKLKLEGGIKQEVENSILLAGNASEPRKETLDVFPKTLFNNQELQQKFLFNGAR